MCDTCSLTDDSNWDGGHNLPHMMPPPTNGSLRGCMQAENAVLRQQSVDGRGSNENDVELMLNMTAVAFSLGLGLAGMAVYLGWSLGLIVMPVQGLG